MRLNTEQIKVLIRETHRNFGENAKIWLFGSRVNDTKKGGDIDLYIETDKESGVIAAKLAMLMSISEIFGEQKIDILIRSRHLKASAIQETAKSSGKELFS